VVADCTRQHEADILSTQGHIAATSEAVAGTNVQLRQSAALPNGNMAQLSPGAVTRAPESRPESQSRVPEQTSGLRSRVPQLSPEPQRRVPELSPGPSGLDMDAFLPPSLSPRPASRFPLCPCTKMHKLACIAKRGVLGFDVPKDWTGWQSKCFLVWGGGKTHRSKLASASARCRSQSATDLQ